MNEDQLLKELDASLNSSVSKLKEDLRGVRGNRPSVELVENIPVRCYDQDLTIRQIGSISIEPPRSLIIQPWDKSAVGPTAKAIEDAHIGLSTSVSGTVIRANLSPLGNERRDELTKLVKKMGEETRIAVRAHRDEILKRGKTAGLTEDAEFRLKEKVQKAVDKSNQEVESSVDGKLAELGEQ